MFYATSIYAGGDIVDAAKCNYQSYAIEGLNCPFCSAAVFWKAASKREADDVIQKIRAHFSHYADVNSDCEARSKNKGSLIIYEQIKAAAKNQRIKIYNKRLVKILLDSKGIKRNRLATVRKIFNDNWCNHQVKLIQIEINQNITSLSEKIFQASQLSNKEKAIEALTQLGVDANVREHSCYLSECDLELHLRISKEILEFLTTKSASYSLANFLEVVLLKLISIPNMTTDQAKSYSPAIYADLIASLIAGTHWLTALNKE